MVARLWGTCQGQDVIFSPTGMRCRVEILDIGSLCDYDTVARMLGADPMAAAAGEDPVRAAPAADPLRAKITGFVRCCG